MKKLLFLFFAISLTLSACGTASTQPAPPTQTGTPTITPTTTQTPISTISSTPTFFHPFPTYTPNATAISIAKQLNGFGALISPNEEWVAVTYPGKIKIFQLKQQLEFEITCQAFINCELILPIGWLPNSKVLYFASLVTGEKLTPFDLFTGLGRFDVQSQKFEKVVDDSSSDLAYSASLSPNGVYFAYAEASDSTPHIKILDARTLDEILTIQVDDGLFAGNFLWSNSSDEVLFISIINCESSIYHLTLKTNSLSKLVNKDPSCIELLFENEEHEIALSKSNYHPLSKSYWYFNLITNEFIQIAPTP